MSDDAHYSYYSALCEIRAALSLSEHDEHELVIATIKSLKAKLDASEWAQVTCGMRVAELENLLALYLSDAPHERGCQDYNGQQCTCRIGRLDEQAINLLEQPVSSEQPDSKGPGA